MKKEDIFTSLFGFSSPTFYNWQREKRPVINLLDKYFSKDELEEFLSTNKINRLENTSYINSFYDKQTLELYDLIFKTHSSKNDFIVFDILIDLIISNKKYNSFEEYCLQGLENTRINRETVLLLLRMKPINSDLFYFIKLNMDDNWNLLLNSIKRVDTNIIWIYDYIQLAIDSKEKGNFSRYFHLFSNERKIPNIPNIYLENSSDINTNAEKYCELLKMVRNIIAEDGWDKIPSIEKTKPFSLKSKDLNKWLDAFENKYLVQGF